MKGSTVALIAIPAVAAAGIGAYFLLRPKKPTTSAAELGYLQAAYGTKATAQMAPMGAQGATASPKPGVLGSAASIVDKFSPGLGTASATVIKGAASLAKSLKFW